MIPNTALVTLVEGNSGTKSDGITDEGFTHNKAYEDEAIAMFSSWRTVAGDYANIPIYALCITGNKPSSKALSIFRDQGVTYIDNYMPESESYSCGYWYVPLGCSWLEENISEDFLIHIDLDMLVLKPITDELLAISDGSYAKIGVIPPEANRMEIPSYEHTFHNRHIADYPVKFNTCFITSLRKNRFYKLWYEALKELAPDRKLCNNDRIYSQWEEHVIDLLYYEGNVKFDMLERFEIGYSWDKLESFSDEELRDCVFFQHDHLGTPGRSINMLNYVSRMHKIFKGS